MAANNFLTISGDDAKTCHRMLRGNKGRNGKPKTGLCLTRSEHRVNMRKEAKADSIESLAGFRIVAKAACPEGYSLGKPLTDAQRNASYDIGIWVNASHAPGLRYVAYVKFATTDGGYLQPAEYHTCMGPRETVAKLLGSKFKLAKSSACAKALAKRKAEAKAKAKAGKASAKTQEAVVEAVADVVAEDAEASDVSTKLAFIREIVAMGGTIADAKEMLNA